MAGTCILFAGQGSQYPGMGKELLEAVPDARTIWEAGSDILGFDLENACLNYSPEQLADTRISQPAILSVSLIALEAVEKLGIHADMVGGHSLGEYAAMKAAGMLTLEDVFRVIRARARAMADCAESHPGAMAAVMAPAEEIESACTSVTGYVVPVNYNSPQQTVIAGEPGAVEQVMEHFAGLGKRCVKLAVSAAFHTCLMQTAADEFREAISSVPFAPPQVDFYSNTTGEKLADTTDMPGYLARHLVSPVRFTRELEQMRRAGAERFVECGPNKVLTGLVRKTLEGVSAWNVENARTLAKLQESLNEPA